MRTNAAAPPAGHDRGVTETPAAASRPPKRHPVVVWVLVVLASVIALASVLTLWVDRQMLDNTAWRKASKELIQDPQVQSALSVYLVNQLYANVDVAGQLKQQLPEQVKPLAGPVSAALRQPATQAVGRLLAAPRVQQLWIEASGRAHQKLVNVLEDKTGYGISTGNGVVTLDLNELVRQLGAELGLPASALDKLPDKAGVITVMRSDQLSAAQQGVRIVHALSIWLLALVLAMYATAIYLARGRRRETLRNIGWAFVFVGLITLVVRRGVGGYAIDALTSPAYRDAGNNAWLIGSEILGQIGRAAILYGIVAVLGASLAGRSRAAVSVRRWMTPTLANRAGLTWSVAGGAYLLVVLWGGTHALRTAWGVLLLGAMVALGVEALRRQAKVELAAAPAGNGAAAVRSLGARIAAARPRPAGNGASAAPAVRSPIDELERLRDLHDTGVITDEEFERGKKLVLS